MAHVKWWAAIFTALLCQAQPQPPEALLAKIRTRVKENLSRLPNFTCTETIQRSLWFKHDATPEMVDTVRLEVAFVQGKELYGWPGSDRIDEPDIGKMAGGSISNGYFALFSNNIFLAPTTTFHYVGRSKLQRTPTEQYDYNVPQTAGAYRLKSARGSAMVGYHGSFWVPEGSLDPVRITVTADEVPTEIGFSAATSLLDFGPVAIANRSYVLPKDAEFVFTDTDGIAHRSHLGFDACHEFVGESVVRFDVPPPPPSVALPDEFTADAELATPIDSNTAAAGDPIQAILRGDIKENGAVVVHKGARLSGRIARITKNGPVYLLDFTFTAIDFDGGHADLSRRSNTSQVQDWQEIRQTQRLRLSRNTRLTLHSQVTKPAQ